MTHTREFKKIENIELIMVIIEKFEGGKAPAKGVEILAKVLETLGNDNLSGEATEAYRRLKESVAEMCLRMKTKEAI